MPSPSTSPERSGDPVFISGKNARDEITSQIWHEMAKSTDVLQTPLQPEGTTAGRFKQQNILENAVDATLQDKVCNCMANKLVDGECFLSGDCQRANLIYKLFCGCCGDFYIGKTQNYVKKRTQTHINHVVKMWKIKQNYLKSLELTDGSSIFSSPPTTGSNRSMTTRAMGTAARTSSPDPGTPDDPNGGNNCIGCAFYLTHFDQRTTR